MQKITFRYISYKTLLIFLSELTSVCVGFVLSLILKAGDLEVGTVLFVSGIVAFLTFLYTEYKLVLRSDLHKIQKGTYLLGEIISYSVVVGMLYLLAWILEATGHFPLYKMRILFFPILPFMEIPPMMLVGLVLQLSLFSLMMLLFYNIKKRKDPALEGKNKKSPSPLSTEKVLSQSAEAEGESEEAEDSEAEGDKETGDKTGGEEKTEEEIQNEKSENGAL